MTVMNVVVSCGMSSMNTGIQIVLRLCSCHIRCLLSNQETFVPHQAASMPETKSTPHPAATNCDMVSRDSLQQTTQTVSTRKANTHVRADDLK